MTKRQAGRPSKGMTMSKHNIELAIKSTQSMGQAALYMNCLLYTSPSPRDVEESRMPSSA